MTELAQSSEVVQAEVVEANRGGLVVDLGLRGFVPLSELASVGDLGRPSAPRSPTRFATTSASGSR
jgi:DNA-directed RNA polymerase subunit E'/Rpb7